MIRFYALFLVSKITNRMNHCQLQEYISFFMSYGVNYQERARLSIGNLDVKEYTKSGVGHSEP